MPRCAHPCRRIHPCHRDTFIADYRPTQASAHRYIVSTSPHRHSVTTRAQTQLPLVSVIPVKPLPPAWAQTARAPSAPQRRGGRGVAGLGRRTAT
jgi:hypothetical protein